MKTQFNENWIYPLVQSGELEIDNLGRVWRVKKRSGAAGGGVRIHPCKKVRAEVMNLRYLQVKAMIGGVRRYAAAHRLVWLHFKGGLPTGITINHINGIKTDNRPENLELATPSEQMIHAKTVLGWKPKGPVGSSNSKTHLSDSDVSIIRARRIGGESFQVLSRDYSISRDAVYQICTRRSWRHIP
ncbi:HNH endonuclease [bacterium]|nr:MAG: HNH endonuclease [bacterium]